MAQFFAVAASRWHAHSRFVRILLTNDDGVNARGLRLLESVARKLSDDIWIVAPTDEQSGAGHSLTLTEPVRLREHDERRFSVTGTPTDAVMLALAHIMKDSPPDLILSGINRKHLLQHISGHPVRHQSGEMRLKLVQFRC